MTLDSISNSFVSFPFMSYCVLALRRIHDKVKDIKLKYDVWLYPAFPIIVLIKLIFESFERDLLSGRRHLFMLVWAGCTPLLSTGSEVHADCRNRGNPKLSESLLRRWE